MGKSCRFDSLHETLRQSNSSAAWGLESCLFLATRQGGLGLTFCDSNVQQKTPIWRDMGRRAFSLVGYPKGKGMGSLLWIEIHCGEAPGGKFNIGIQNKLDFAATKFWITPTCVSDVRQLPGGTRSQSLELLNVLESAKVCVLYNIYYILCIHRYIYI